MGLYAIHCSIARFKKITQNKHITLWLNILQKLNLKILLFKKTFLPKKVHTRANRIYWSLVLLMTTFERSLKVKATVSWVGPGCFSSFFSSCCSSHTQTLLTKDSRISWTFSWYVYLPSFPPLWCLQTYYGFFLGISPLFQQPKSYLMLSA